MAECESPSKGLRASAPAFVPAKNLDSPEVTNTFLAAVGFQSAPRDVTAIPKNDEEPGSHPKQGESSGRISNPPREGCETPGRSTKLSRKRGSRGQRRVKSRPEPPVLNYWEAQRIAKGILDPYSHPSFRRRNQDRVDDSGWEVHWAPATNSREDETGWEPSPATNSREDEAGWEPSPATNSREDETGWGVSPASGVSNASSAPSPHSWGAVSAKDTWGGGVGSEEKKERTGRRPSGDIRHTIGLKASLHKSGNTWLQYNWAAPDGRDHNETFEAPSYLGAFIMAWMDTIPDGIVVPLRQDKDLPEHWRCDIDTSTGSFLPPINCPDSIVDHSQIEKRLEWRRLNSTATAEIQRRLRLRRPNYRSSHYNSNSRIPLDGTAEDILAATGRYPVYKVRERRIEKPEYHPFVPRIACFLRPALPRDMMAVSNIYNWEVEHGLQTLDSQPLSLQDFKRILATTQERGMPFIVAVRGSVRDDHRLTRGNVSLSPFGQVPFYSGDKYGEVLGFAFLSVWQSDLAGTGTGSSRATARINVFVHPDYRRKKIGYSLLDMLLTIVSNRFVSETAYDFFDPENKPIYKKLTEPGRERQYHQLYLSYFVKHKHRTNGDAKLEEEQKESDKELAWVKKFLEERFNFDEVARFEAVHRSAKCREGPVYWLDEVVFQHTCQYDPRRINEDY